MGSEVCSVSGVSVLAGSVWFSTNSMIFGVERVAATVVVGVGVVCGLRVGSSSSSTVLPVKETG